MAVMVGGVFAFTVKAKFVEAVRLPSFTVMVIVVVPLAPAAGVSTTLRLAPLPPRAILASGTSAVFEDEAERVKAPIAVSASPIVKAMSPVGVPTFVD